LLECFAKDVAEQAPHLITGYCVAKLALYRATTDKTRLKTDCAMALARLAGSTPFSTGQANLFKNLLGLVLAQLLDALEERAEQLELKGRWMPGNNWRNR